MAKAEWGKKRICGACGALFYDLNQEKIVCPACGVDFDPEAILRTRRVRPGVEDSKSASPDSPQPTTANGDEADVDEVVFDEDEAEAKSSELTGQETEVSGDVSIDMSDDVDVDDMGVVSDDGDEADGIPIEDVSELDDSDDDIAVVIKGDDDD